MPTLEGTQKDDLLRVAHHVADALAFEYGRSRVSAPVYAADDAAHGYWSVVVTGMIDDIEVARRRAFIDGHVERERDEPAPIVRRPGGGWTNADVAGAEDNAGVHSDADPGL